MTGIGLSDFMRGATGGAAAGQQAMAQGVGNLMQMLQQKKAQQASFDQQAAMQKSSQDFQAQQQAQAQAQAQAHFDAQQQLEAATHGLRSQPVFTRDAAAQRVVEAPQRARDFNAAHPNTNIPVPGMGGLSIPADAQVGNHPLLESMETRAAMEDPANAAAVKGPEGESQGDQWNRMRQQAWGKQTGNEWVRDPSLAPPPKKEPLTGAPVALLQKFHTMAEADTPKPPRLAAAQQMIQAAMDSNQPDLAASLEAHMNANYADDIKAYHSAVEQRSRGLMQDAVKGGVDESPLLQQYLSRTGGDVPPQSKDPGQWRSMVDQVDQKPDDQKTDAELEAAEKAFSSPTPASTATAKVPAAAPFTPRGREPVAASSQYPTAQLAQLYPKGRVPLPNTDALATAARAPTAGADFLDTPPAPAAPPPVPAAPPSPADGVTGVANRAWTGAANSDLANSIFGLPETVQQLPDSPGVPPAPPQPYHSMSAMAPPGVGMRGGRVSTLPPPQHISPRMAAVESARPDVQNIRVDDAGSRLLSGPGAPPPGVTDLRQRDGMHGVIDARANPPSLMDKAGGVLQDGGNALASLLGGSSSAAASEGGGMPDAKGFPLPEELVQVGQAKLVAPAAKAYSAALADPSLSEHDRAALGRVFSSTRSPAQQNRLHSQWLGQGSKPGGGIASYPPPAPKHAPAHGHLAGSGLDLHHDLTPAARQSLNRNGWHRTVKGDLGHWEFTGSTDIDEG